MSVVRSPKEDYQERVAVVFVPLIEEHGVELVDPIERHRYALTTPDPIDPRDADTDRFRFPVDSAIAFEADTLRLPSVQAIYVRDPDGEMVAEAEHLADESFPKGRYTIEICAPIKIYLRVEAGMTIDSALDGTTISFERNREVLVGARSHHERPAATVTTTADPVDMMAAVSTFGSALKTTSPERSFPTLRGHPPTVELGGRLSIPDEFDPPDTGVRIELPPARRAVYVAAPLAYYLGADVVSGTTPRIVTDAGFESPLEAGDELVEGVERALKRTFLLDCLVRTEGLYPVDLHERAELEPALDLDFGSLYDRPLGERLEAYFDVPYPTIEPYVPDWSRTAHVDPAPESVEILPYLLDDLALVRPLRGQELDRSDLQEASVDAYLRDGDFTRSTRATAAGDDIGPFVRPDADTDALEQVWVGDGIPMGASKAIPEAFDHRLERSPTTGDIDIAVVCNDAEMEDEREEVDAAYGSREQLPFDVTIEHGLTVEELRSVIAADTDFFHYIGHIDDDGFQCSDGALDVASIETSGVDAFLLNACQSYEQGRRLVEAGSIGGVVTLSDVINSGAVRIGHTMARLLNQGFPLHSALEIARGASLVGGLYAVVGDGGVSVAQPASAAPLISIDSIDDDFTIEYITHVTDKWSIGSMIVPYINNNDYHYLVSGNSPSFTVSKSELTKFLSLENVPTRFNGDLYWSTDLDLTDI